MLETGDFGSTLSYGNCAVIYLPPFGSGDKYFSFKPYLCIAKRTFHWLAQISSKENNLSANGQ